MKELQVGDKMGYRLHNTTELIIRDPATVVSIEGGTAVLDNGIALKRNEDGDWRWHLKDRYGKYFTTFYRLRPV